jgi:catechol 2,3-dioxygenase-like lactoylglutathione lyase family enzyme
MSAPSAVRLDALKARAMKINFKRLDHVQVCIPPGAEARAREFYSRVLGLEEIEKPAALKSRGGLWYKIADVQLHLGVEPETGNLTKRHPAFEVERLEEVRAHLGGNGVSLREETDLPGVRRFSFFDPFGNRFELMERTIGARQETLGADAPAHA